MSGFDPGVTDGDLAAVFAPFVTERFALDDPAWTALVGEQALLQRRKRRRRRWLGWLRRARRTQATVESSYTLQWQTRPLEVQLAREGPTIPCVWRDTGMRARAVATKRVHLLFLLRVVERLKPARVLEVGCGNGLNLFVMAGRFPDARFTGVELTGGGVAAAEGVRALPELPEAVRAFSPEPLLDPKPSDRITLVRGNAAALPFRDASFDLVFTALALEQMEQVRGRALAEIRRVARAHTAMVEPFREWNAHGMERDYISANDYFAGSIADLARIGLRPLYANADMPRKIIYRPGLVVCRLE